MFCWLCCVMIAGTALYIRLLVYAGLSLFLISGLYVYMVVCVVYMYNLTEFCSQGGACSGGEPAMGGYGSEGVPTTGGCLVPGVACSRRGTCSGGSGPEGVPALGGLVLGEGCLLWEGLQAHTQGKIEGDQVQAHSQGGS